MMSLNREKGSRVYVIRNDLPPKEQLQLNRLSITSWDSHLKSPQKKVYIVKEQRRDLQKLHVLPSAHLLPESKFHILTIFSIWREMQLRQRTNVLTKGEAASSSCVPPKWS